MLIRAMWIHHPIQYCELAKYSVLWVLYNSMGAIPHGYLLPKYLPLYKNLNNLSKFTISYFSLLYTIKAKRNPTYKPLQPKMNFNPMLLGPPEIYPKAPSTPSTIQSRIDNLHLGQSSGNTTAELGFTENNSLTYVATGNRCPNFLPRGAQHVVSINDQTAGEGLAPGPVNNPKASM